MMINTAVPLSHYSQMIQFARETIKKHGIKGYILGHAGDGNLHLIVAGNFEDSDFMKRLNQTNEERVLFALSVGGTATGEHGVGMGKQKFMRKEHGESLRLMKQIKQLLDPNEILNPGKIFPEEVQGYECARGLAISVVI